MRLGQQDFGQIEPDLKASRELERRLMELLVAEPQPG